MHSENFSLWLKGNQANKAEVWRLGKGFYEVKRKNEFSDGYLSPVFFVWDMLNDKQIIATLNYTEAATAWSNTSQSRKCSQADKILPKVLTKAQ